MFAGLDSLTIPCHSYLKFLLCIFLADYIDIVAMYKKKILKGYSTKFPFHEVFCIHYVKTLIYYTTQSD